MRRKGQAYMLKWIVYSLVLAGIISGVLYLQSSAFSVNTETFGLENELLFERAINQVYSPDPLTGIRNAPSNVNNEMLAQLFRSEKELSLSVNWKNKIYYSDKELYIIMSEREIVKYDHRIKKKNFGGEEFELRIVMQK